MESSPSDPKLDPELASDDVESEEKPTCHPAEEEIARFIATVRQLVSREYSTKPEMERVFRRIKNLSGKLFRDYVGYTPRGEYRLKQKGERVFHDMVKELGGQEAALEAHGAENQVLTKILRGEKAPESPARPAAPRMPLHLVEKPVSPKWAEEFDPESRDPLEVVARGVEEIDLDQLDEDEGFDLEFESLKP